VVVILIGGAEMAGRKRMAHRVCGRGVQMLLFRDFRTSRSNAKAEARGVATTVATATVTLHLVSNHPLKITWRGGWRQERPGDCTCTAFGAGFLELWNSSGSFTEFSPNYEAAII
jgi:hypothetical protein